MRKGPQDFDFKVFYNLLKDKGYAIYPGKLTKASTFRIGRIGEIFEKDMDGVLAAIEAVLKEMGISI